MNTVFSMLFFSHHGLGEATASLHADNFCGQNKNNTMVQYLMRRVLTGLHQTIKLHFMITGHTKFSPDACFGLIKRKFRKSDVSSLDDLACVVKESASWSVPKMVVPSCLPEIGPRSSPPAWMVSSNTITFASSETIQGQSSARRLLWRRRKSACCYGFRGIHLQWTNLHPSLPMVFHLSGKNISTNVFVSIDARDLVCPNPAKPSHQPPNTIDETPPKRRRE